METPMDASAQTRGAEAQQTAMDLARWWWAWLIVGSLWIMASIVILQFRQASVTLVGLIVGIMFLLAGVQEFVVAVVSGSWKALRIIFGGLLVIGGVFALFNPVGTFLALADALGFLFALIGIFWIIEAVATLTINEFWWVRLICGFIMLGLGFWAGGQFLATNAYALLILVGIWALFHGLTDIVRAFVIKSAGALVSA